MAQRRWTSWLTRWLEKHGLGHVADALDHSSARQGNAAALHDMARRALGRGEPELALKRLLEAIRIAPDDAGLFCSLGAAYRQTGAFDAAKTAYEQALTLKPDYLQALSNMGEWCLAKGQAEQALSWFEQALQISPRFFEARLNKTAALFELARFTEALSLANQLLSDYPDSAEVHLNLGNFLVHTGKTKQGIKHFKKALAIQPGYPEAHYNLASLLGSQADMAQAIGYLERRLKQQGDSIQNLCMLAAAYQTAGKLSKSEHLCKRILKRQPENLTALITLGSCLSNGGNSAAALTLYERVIKADPSQAGMGSNILFEYNYAADRSRQALFEAHLSWADRFEAPLIQAVDFSKRSRDPMRRLKIGYVSGDFVRHPVGFLLRDILKHHAARQYQIHCYSMAIRPEEVLPELREAADVWEDIFFLTDEEVYALIKKSEIDILVDLSGHTAFHRLQVFARKPAPIQVEWIGYFHSTGLSSIDYFITDPHTSPKGSGQLFSETPVCLPRTRFCYGPPEYAPEVGALPFDSKHCITFGSFNRLAKITDDVVQTWSTILQKIPDSRLVIKSGALSETLAKKRLLDRFLQYGIAAERIDLRESSLHHDMLAQYGDIDMALDTFPFNGGMTTLEALWMGVPVVTLAGDTVVSRQTVSALANLGLDQELAFPSLEGYVQGVIALANNPLRLAELRHELRPRMAQSALRDSKQFTQDLEALYQSMWAAWCEGKKLPSEV